jgi:hypothetical protein
VVFDSCAGRVSDIAVRNQLLACGPTIEAVANEYNELGNQCRLKDFPVTPYVFDAPLERLRGLYDSVLRDGGERHIYDAIRGRADRGVCPQCGVGRVRTLDHYLPKTLFPALAVVPENLIPTCRDCNLDKRVHYATEAEGFIFHPYYDDWDAYRLVEAEIVYEPRLNIQYFIGQPSNATDLIVQRARAHFRVLSLAELYAMNAGAALAEVKVNCARAALSEAAAVHEFLCIHEAAAASAEPNGWRAAMFKAMAEDWEFWNGGYELIN